MEPTVVVWNQYLESLSALPFVKIYDDNGQVVREWSNLYDYYAEMFNLNTSVKHLQNQPYCEAKESIGVFAQALDQRIQELSSAWFGKDEEELSLLMTLRQTL